MSKSVLRGTLIGSLVVLVLLVCFPLMAISSSLGRNGNVTNSSNRLHLQPGQYYMVYTEKSIALPPGVKAWAEHGMSTRLRHCGTHKDDPEQSCAGFINMALQDNGCIEYECVLCRRRWLRDANGKMAMVSDKD